MTRGTPSLSLHKTTPQTSYINTTHTCERKSPPVVPPEPHQRVARPFQGPLFSHCEVASPLSSVDTRAGVVCTDEFQSDPQSRRDPGQWNSLSFTTHKGWSLASGLLHCPNIKCRLFSAGISSTNMGRDRVIASRCCRAIIRRCPMEGLAVRRGREYTQQPQYPRNTTLCLLICCACLK